MTTAGRGVLRCARVVGMGFVGMGFVLCSTAQAATITILNSDGAGEGYNDSTPAAPVGGNTGTTRGAQRRDLSIRPSCPPCAVR